MDNRHMFNKISRLRTTDLLITKMGCIRRIALYKALKLGLMAVMGVIIGQIAKVVFSTDPISGIEYISAIALIYTIGVYLLLNAFESGATAQKELICDLLALRLSRAGKKGK